ncbi:hypothetical protein [Bdellovibrio bacteriovorus]|uniref:hypothetical protein n=1 Tax=Bdellovibrio bacteriovorus TaxID=959 RepID=UPI0035A6BC2A
MNVISLILSTLMLATSASASTQPAFTAAQEALLLEIKGKTIELVERQKGEAEKLRRCFAFRNLCDEEIKAKLPLIRTAIKQKSEEYRLLVGLANGKTVAGPGVYNNVAAASLGMTLPYVRYETRFNKDQSELSLLRRLYKEDYQAISDKADLKYQDLPKSPRFDPTGYAIENDLKQAAEFYRMQAFLIIHQVPFVIYLPNDKPTDQEVATALGKYIERVHKALSELYDTDKNPMISFLVYEPVVASVVAGNPVKQRMVQLLLTNQKHAVGLKAWLERNSPSIKLAAFSTCSLVAAVLQAWPVSLACGGTVTAITGKQLYDDYHKMRGNFALWLTGAQSHTAVKNAEARVLYSTLALFFAGQSVGNTLVAIETSLVATLSSLPTVAAARFTSLTALREGSLRFASRTIEMKGKDLGASLFAASYANVTDKDLHTSREDRIFTYKDLLLLQQTANQQP